MSNLALELKQLIIDALFLEDVSPNDIEDDAPLFGEGLGLDSIDALELGLAIKNRYQVTIDAESEGTRKHFSSVASLVKFINGNDSGERPAL